MSGTTLDLQRKISSAGDLQSVVRSMKALSASSIGQYEKSVAALVDYYRTVELGLGSCLRERTPTSYKVEANQDNKKNLVSAVVFGSDQGLVGQFNQLLADYAVATLEPLPGKRQIWAVGDHMRACLVDTGLPLLGDLKMPSSVQMITALVGQIQLGLEANQSLDENSCVYIFYNRPKTGTLPEPTSQQLLPLDAKWAGGLVQVAWPTKTRPEVIGGENPTMRALIREYVFISLFRACAQSLASENASRLAAMERADRNIDELLDTLQNKFHRLRQASIDEELFDVVSGFEALSKVKR